VIEGRIVGPEGKPVAARLRQLLLNQFFRQAYLYASAPGYAPRRVGPMSVGYDKPAVPLTIELQPGFTGRLRLVLPDGKLLDRGEVEVMAQDDLQAEGMPMAKLPINGQPILVPHCPEGPLLLKVRVPDFAEQEIRDVHLDRDRATDVKVPIRLPATMGLLRGKPAMDLIGKLKPAWSAANNGIEFGISHIGDKRQFRAGERVPLGLISSQPRSVALLRETLKPGEAFGFQHLGIGLGKNPTPGENWNPF
jgi:hypothetical protein